MADHLPPISDETLEILKTIPTPTLIDALWVMKWPPQRQFRMHISLLR